MVKTTTTSKRKKRVKASSSNLSEYEKARLQQIAKNKAVLESLNLVGMKDKMKKSIHPKKKQQRPIASRTRSGRTTSSSRKGKKRKGPPPMRMKYRTRAVRAQESGEVTEKIDYSEEHNPSDYEERRKARKRQENEDRRTWRERIIAEAQVEYKGALLPQTVEGNRSEGVEIRELGIIVSSDPQTIANFWSKSGCLYSHPYPVGYKATTIHWNQEFLMTIDAEDDGQGNLFPLFTVKSLDSGKMFSGYSPTYPWTQFCLKRSTGERLSGPRMYGFSDHVTMALIRNLPNYEVASKIYYDDESDDDE